MHTPNFEKAMELLDMLTPNDLSDITSQIINSCKKKDKKLFYLLKMLNCRIPIDLCSYLNLSYSSLLKEGIHYPVIQKALGHSSPNATKYYTKIDISRLRDCALEVPPPSGNFERLIKESGHA